MGHNTTSFDLAPFCEMLHGLVAETKIWSLRLVPRIQTGYHFGKKGTPFIYLLLKKGTPFTYLI